MTDPSPATFSHLGLDRSYSPAIIERFAPEFDKLLWLALMAPWPGQQ